MPVVDKLVVQIRTELNKADIAKVQGRLTNMKKRLESRSSGLFSGLGKSFRSGLGIGAGIAAFNKLTGAISGASRGMLDFTSNLQGSKIGLATIVGAVDGIPFEEAQQRSEKLFNALQQDAIKSTATTGELLEVFRGIAGPIRKAGASFDDIRGTALDIVNASNAVGVDLQQAARDANLIVSGRAGIQVKLFQQLRVMGLITEEAQKFNKLSTSERVERLNAALKKAGAGADAYAKSWAGISSTLKDIFENTIAKALTPILDAFASEFGKLAEFLIANKDKISATFESAGRFIADLVRRMSAFVQNSNIFRATVIVLTAVMGALAIAAAAANWPFLLIAGVIGVLILAMDELITFLEGGDTLLGRFLDHVGGAGTAAEVANWIKDAWAALLPVFRDVAIGVGGYLKDMWSQAKVLISVVQQLWEILKPVRDAIGTVAGALGRGAGKVLEKAFVFGESIATNGSSNVVGPGQLQPSIPRRTGGAASQQNNINLTVNANGLDEEAATRVAQRAVSESLDSAARNAQAALVPTAAGG